MGTTRINITLPEEIMQSLNDFVKQGSKSSFIAHAIREKIRELEIKKIAGELAEGYKKTYKEDKKLSSDFDFTVGDGLDEY